MLIALLAVLGVDLIVLVAFAAIVITRKRWVKRQPGAFRGSIKVASGEIDGLSPKWRRGSGHWVRDVLVWTEAPLRFRNELVPTDRLDERGVVAWRHLIPVAAALAYWTAAGLGGSGFIAAFVAGLPFGTLLRQDTGEITIFTDEAGALRDGVTCLSSAPCSPDPRSRMSPGRWPSTPPSA
jgi:hypothetical protein